MMSPGLAAPATVPISVVLVTPSDSEAIRLTALHLAEQTARDRMEVVIVAPRAESVESLRGDLRGCRVVRVVEAGPIVSRAAAAVRGVRAASGRIIALVENHAYPQPGWADAFLRAHEGPWAAVGPRIEMFNPHSSVARADALLSYAALLGREEPMIAESLPWHNSAYKREILAPLEPELDLLLDPEGRLLARLRAEGHRLLLEQAAVVRHLFSSSLEEALLQRAHWGREFAAGRSGEWGAARRVSHALMAPVFPAVHLVARRAHLRRLWTRLSVPRTIPTLLLLLAAQSAGEALGYVAGAGRSKAWFNRHEMQIVERVNRRERRDLDALLAEFDARASRRAAEPSPSSVP